MENILYLVIPCYNEEEVLPETSKRLREKMQGLIDSGKISEKSRICLVNDGSKDKTWEIISQLHSENKLFSGIKLSRNRGHQNALVCGLMTVKEHCDAAISLDADLQDDVNAIDEMVDKWLDGCDIVYGVRSARQTDTAFKRATAQGYYKVLAALGVEIVYNHADYRLMSKRALEALADFKEVNLFLRGIVPMIGFKTDVVTYERSERFAGESKYPLKKMLAFAAEGITSMSIKPIKFITGFGVFLLFAAFVAFVVFLVLYLCGIAVPHWIPTFLSVWAVGGFNLLGMGIIGEYVGKIYLETKSRPRFIVEDFLND